MVYLAATGFQWWNEGVGVISTEERFISMLSEVRTISYLADLTEALPFINTYKVCSISRATLSWLILTLI